MTLNKVRTITEYEAEGFEGMEAFLVQTTDCLFNEMNLNDNWKNENNNYTEKAKTYFSMIEVLGL